MLVPDQTNGKTLSSAGDFSILVRGDSEVTLMSVTVGIICQPVSFVWVISPLLLVESMVLTPTDATASEELYIVIFKFISQNDTAKLWCLILGPSSIHDIGLVLPVL